MRLDVRPVQKLRQSPQAQAAFGPIIEALFASSADLTRLRVVCDWIQYRNNFREPAVCRPILVRSGDPSAEVAVDLRRCHDVDLASLVKDAVAEHNEHTEPTEPTEHAARCTLEPWVPGRESCIWRFNTLYWQALSLWEKATGKEYEQALPGGQTDARNTEMVAGLILELLRIWDDLDARHALPDELLVGLERDTGVLAGRRSVAGVDVDDVIGGRRSGRGSQRVER